MAKTSRAAKRLIEDSIPHVGADVVIIAPGVSGHGYVGTTMSTKTAANIDDMITLTQQALKKMRRWRAQRQRDEARYAPVAD